MLSFQLCCSFLAQQCCVCLLVVGFQKINKKYQYSVTSELLDFTEKIHIDFYASGQMWSLTEHSEDGKTTFTSHQYTGVLFKGTRLNREVGITILFAVFFIG